jgi:hypothetical protein
LFLLKKEQKNKVQLTFGAHSIKDLILKLGRFCSQTAVTYTLVHAVWLKVTVKKVTDIIRILS